MGWCCHYLLNMIGVKLSLHQYTLQLPRGATSSLQGVRIRQVPLVQFGRSPQEIPATPFPWAWTSKRLYHLWLRGASYRKSLPVFARIFQHGEYPCSQGCWICYGHPSGRDRWSHVACVYLQDAKHTLTHKHKNKSMGLSEKPHGTLKRHFHKTQTIWILLSIFTSFGTLSGSPSWENLFPAWYVRGVKGGSLSYYPDLTF